MARPLMSIVILLVGPMVIACSACETRDISPTEPVSLTDQEQRDQEWYARGQYAYRGPANCTFVSPEGAEFLFDCGTILMGLKEGVRAQDVRDLLASIDGVVEKDRSGGEQGWLVVNVPPKTEREAILESFRDDRVRYAALNFVGPAVL